MLPRNHLIKAVSKLHPNLIALSHFHILEKINKVSSTEMSISIPVSHYRRHNYITDIYANIQFANSLTAHFKYYTLVNSLVSLGLQTLITSFRFFRYNYNLSNPPRSYNFKSIKIYLKKISFSLHKDTPNHERFEPNKWHVI